MKVSKFMSKEPQAYDALWQSLIEDCNLSIHTKLACKANGIYTIGDLCKLHKTDWPKFRNGGVRSFNELNNFLHDNGLDWADWP